MLSSVCGASHGFRRRLTYASVADVNSTGSPSRRLWSNLGCQEAASHAARVCSWGSSQSPTAGPAASGSRSSRTVALVGFLAAHAGSPQTRQRIAGLFWPDSTDAQALTNLRRELHNLRQVLGDEPSLVVTSRDLCWRDTETCRVDLRIFDIERKAALAAAAVGR